MYDPGNNDNIQGMLQEVLEEMGIHSLKCQLGDIKKSITFAQITADKAVEQSNINTGEIASSRKV